MKLCHVAVLSLSLLCGGCSAITGLESPTNLQDDPLALAQNSTVPMGVSLELTPDDVALFSRLHDTAVSRCLYFKNKETAFFTVGSISVTNGDLMLASVAPAMALTGAKAGPTAIVAGLSTLFANQLKSFIGLPNPGTDYTPIIAGIDYVYNTYTNSPGIASMMNDPTKGQPLRLEALKEYRVALQQTCISPLKLPASTTSIYQTGTTTTTTTTKP